MKSPVQALIYVLTTALSMPVVYLLLWVPVLALAPELVFVLYHWALVLWLLRLILKRTRIELAQPKALRWKKGLSILGAAIYTMLLALFASFGVAH